MLCEMGVNGTKCAAGLGEANSRYAAEALILFSTAVAVECCCFCCVIAVGMVLDFTDGDENRDSRLLMVERAAFG